MRQVLLTGVERVLRLGPVPRQFSRDRDTYMRVAAALCGGLAMLGVTSIILKLLI